MAGKTLLLTGATGFIGFRVLREALEAGYNVRVAVRSEAKADAVRSNPVLQAMGKDAQLSYIIVPDFLASGAFDEAVRDVQEIIHVASPQPFTTFPDGDLEELMIEPAVRGTIGLFESAHKVDTVKRIIVTSSAIAILPLAAAFVETVDDVFGPESRMPEMPPPFLNPWVAYTASKIAALNRAEAWVQREKPTFDAIHIHPAMVYGRDDLCLTTKDYMNTTNSIPIRIALGTVDAQEKCPINCSHVDDVARVHLLSLDPKVQGNQSFVFASSGSDSNPSSYTEFNAVIAKRFPDAVSDGRLPNTGAMTTIVGHLDTSKTKETFGFEPSSYEDTVESVIGHYLELLDKESRAALSNGH